MANDVGRKMQRTLRGLAAGLLCLGLLAAGRAGAAENGKFRLGIVTFLSGGAAGPFGVPAGNAAKITIDALNKGAFPAPYAKLRGINGLEIEPVDWCRALPSFATRTKPPMTPYSFPRRLR